MNLKQIKPTTSTDSLITISNMKKPIMIHLILDGNTTIKNVIYKLNIALNNCYGILEYGTKTVSIGGGKVFNASQYYKLVKAELESAEDSSKNLKVINTLPKKFPENKFIFFDRELLRMQLKYMRKTRYRSISMFSEYLIDSLIEDHQMMKTSFSEFDHYYFIVTDAVDIKNSPEESIVWAFKNFIRLKDKNITFDLIHNFVYVDKTMFRPVIMIKRDDSKYVDVESGKFLISTQNINTILKEMSEVTKMEIPSDDAENPAPTASPEENKAPQESNIVTPASNVVTVKNPFDISVDKESLKKLAARINLDDEEIVKNARLYIDNYIKSNNLKKENLKNVDVYHLLLKAIKYNVHGTDEVTDIDIKDADTLFKQLYDSETVHKKIENIPVVHNFSLDVNEAVTVKEVSAPVRKEFEFGENLDHKINYIFKALEYMPKYKIKVENIEKQYVSDKFNSYIEYTLTVRNMEGGYKEPYKLKVKIPKLVNGKYFRLDGKDYICANQLVFEPLTKTEKNEVRFLSNFSTITMYLTKLDFDISDMNDVVEYIKSKYPKLIESISGKKIKLSNGAEINLNGDEIIFNSPDYYVKFDNGEYNLYDSNGNLIRTISSKNEFIFDYLRSVVLEENPNDKLGIVTSKFPPMIMIHIQGVRVPLIVFLAQQLGLTNALTKCGIEYTIGSKSEHDGDNIKIPLEDGKNLYIYPKSLKDKFIVNGLLRLKFSFNNENINQPGSLTQYLNSKYGTRTSYNFDMSVLYHIDPITRDLLKYKNLPTNLIDVMVGPMIDMLLNEPVRHINDMRMYRVRQSEVITALLYRELLQAHARYRRSLETTKSESERLYLNEDWIIKSLLGANETEGNSILSYTNAFNPIQELKDDTKLIKSGPGGIMSKQAFKAAHRDIHLSQIGIVGANSTTEYQDVGINIRHCINPEINSKYGFYRFKKITDENAHEALTVDEMLTPFIHQMDSTRAILSTTHSGQVVPLKDAETPLVASPAHFIIHHMASKKFVITAEDDGVVIDVSPGEYMTVQYKNGLIKTYDISPRLSSTKRSTYLIQNMVPFSTKKGDVFHKGQMIAWADGLFNGSSYCSGKNVVMALMNYKGFSHEDGYVISEKMAKKFVTKYVKELTVIIPSNTTVHKLETQIGKDVNVNDVLVEFSYDDSGIDSYFDKYNIVSDNEDEQDNEQAFSLNGKKITVKAYNGKIVDIRIYPNSRKMPDRIKKLYDTISKNIKSRVEKLKKHASNEKEIADALDNVDIYQLKIGGHKHRNTEFDGFKIVYYIDIEKEAEIGDKLANRYGAKGIITKILSEEHIPRAEVTGEIDIFLSPCGLLGRKNIAILKEMYLGKIMYFMPQVLKNKMKEGAKTGELKKLVLDVYNVLDSTKDKRILKAAENVIKSKKDSDFREEIQSGLAKYIIVIPPFVNVSFKQIIAASEMLGIPLEERVYLPDEDVWTKHKVPVGVTYVQQLEQFGIDYRSVRSIAKYKFVTGQPTKGKKNIGGQTVAPLDVYALLGYDAPNLIKELMTAKSDDFKSKAYIVSEIITKGEAPEDFEVSNKLRSEMLKNTLITGLGLAINA